MTRTFWLSCHVGYACRHSGACCSSGWPIPIELQRAVRLGEAVASGSLEAPLHWLRPAERAPDDIAGVLALTPAGHCVFRAHQRCVIHGAIGHEMLPSACQHFPRICLLDDRGVFVTLSHYCPTAASMLFEHEGPVRIVEGPPALPGGIDPEGFDARGALPPMRARDQLFAPGEYSALESRMVELLTTLAPPRALQAIASEAGVTATSSSVVDVFEAVRLAVPAPWSWDAPPRDLDAIPAEFGRVAGRFLAAHAFASWGAYRAESVAPVVRGVEAAWAVLSVESSRASAERGGRLDTAALHTAIRQSDLLLLHYADRERLAGLH